MPFSSLYQKYRPQTFSELVGQPHVAKTLANAVERGHVFHAYLFSGPRGTGKTSTARILAKAVNCEKGPTPEPCGECQPCREIAAGTFSDVFEIDAATHSKVEETRDFLSNVPTGLSAMARKKFYIVDEVHMLSTHAFNALLKTLEEPPEHVVFVLATTEPNKVPPTIAGRCQHFEFRLIPPAELADHYASICKREGIEFERAAIERVATLARGSARDGLSLLDQLLAATGKSISLADVASVLGDDDAGLSADLARSIATGDIEKCLETTTRVADLGKDFRAFANRFAAYLRDLMIASYLPSRQTQAVAAVDSEGARELAEIAKLLGRPSILRCLEIAGEMLASMASGSPPRLAFELGVVRMCRPEEVPDTRQVARRVEALEAEVARISRDLRAVREETRSPTSDKATARAPISASDASSGPPASASETPPPKTGAQTSTAEAPDDSEIDLEGAWRRFLSALKEQKKMKAHAVFQEGRPASIEGSTLVLEFPARYEYHARSAERLGHQLAEVVVGAFGRPLKVVSRLAASGKEAGDEDPAERQDGAHDEVAGVAPESVAPTGAVSEEKVSPGSEPSQSEVVERLLMAELGAIPIEPANESERP